MQNKIYISHGLTSLMSGVLLRRSNSSRGSTLRSDTVRRRSALAIGTGCGLFMLLFTEGGNGN